MFDLTDKAAFVAGGAGYLGSAVCRGLRAQGARVIVADLNEDRARQLADELNAGDKTPSSIGVPMDLRSESAITGAIDQATAEFGHLDVLINTSYSPHGASLTQITGEGFSTALAANVTGTFLLARLAREKMPQGGSMIFFSSMYGRVSPDPRLYEKPMDPNPIEYGIAKAGLEQMIRYLAVSWAGNGIRVNGIAPGAFPHPATQSNHPEFVKRLTSKIPLARIGKPEEIVGAVVFLAADESSYVTGQTLVIDGGWTAW